MVSPQVVSVSPGETSTAKEIVASPVFPALGFALAFSQGDSPPGPTSWLCTLLPPPTDLVIALQHFLI
jgi:hypothetical protein